MDFFLASYGIKVEMAANTCFVWKPTDFHGTSLPNYSPDSNMMATCNQVGLAITTSSRLEGIWRSFQENKIDAMQAHAMLVSETEHSDGLEDESSGSVEGLSAPLARGYNLRQRPGQGEGSKVGPEVSTTVRRLKRAISSDPPMTHVSKKRRFV